MRPMNDNATATPTMDAVLAALAVSLPPALRWSLQGWAAHIRDARHQNHAANSWAKHRAEWGSLYELVQALTVARLMDFGLSPEGARSLMDARIEARDAATSAPAKRAG